MNFFVTGGCGFIGSSFIRYLFKAHPKAKVINLDSLTYAAHPDTNGELSALGKGAYEFVHGDIGSTLADDILKTERIDVVVNFAAETHVDRSILDPSSFVHTNVMGVQNLLDLTRKYNNTRLVHVSTDEVYGSLEPPDAPFSEISPLSPNSPYAASKASADLLALASFRTYGQRVIITRCSNNYGPYQFPEKLLPLVIANALENHPVPVYGDGKQVRDWIYVEDHCRAIDLVVEKGRPGEIYNVGASVERQNIDVIKLVLDLLEKPHSLIRFVGDRPAHDRRYGLDSSKIRLELQWKPNVMFEDGLKKTVDWYLRNKAWWQKVRGEDYFKYYEANYRAKFTAAGGASR